MRKIEISMLAWSACAGLLALGCDNANKNDGTGTGGEVSFAGFAITGDDESDDGFTDGADTQPLADEVGAEAQSDDQSELPPEGELDPEALPPEGPDRVWRAVIVVWGQAHFNPALKAPPTAWNGRVRTDSGVLRAVRTLGFERGVAVEGETEVRHDHLVRDQDPAAVSFETVTTVHHDGLLLLLSLPRDASALRGDFVFETEHFQKSVPLAELLSGKVMTFLADDLGNGLLIASHLPHRCPHGMLRLTWERKNDRGGVLGGKVYGPAGEVAGYVVGIWGEVDGKRRFKGSYLGLEREFRGTVRGTWAPFPATSGLDGGTFRGIWKAAGQVRGVLGGVYRVGATPEEGTAVGFWRAACRDLGAACRGDETLPPPPEADCSCEPDAENDFDGACACEAAPPSSCVPAEPPAAEPVQ